MENQHSSMIRPHKWHAKTFVMQRKTLPYTELSSFFAKSYGAIYNTIYKHGMLPSSAPCGIFFSVNSDKTIMEVGAAVPVKGAVPELKGFEIVEVPDSNSASMLYIGSYDDIGDAYKEIEAYATQEQLKPTWMIEEYLTDPNIEKDPMKLKTNIYFLHD